jgi:hypothetical protein
MTLQFRSRIKPAIDYSNILNSYGVCCGVTGATGSSKSFVECFNEGGHFVPLKGKEDIDSFVCPDVDTRRGCCCSCSYVTSGDLGNIPTYSSGMANPYLSSGTRSNVTKCECNRIGGKWTEGDCQTLTQSNWENFCVSNNQDIRAPRACCHLEFDEDTGWPTNVKCEDVCTSADCAALSTDVYPSVFSSGSRCGNPPLISGQSPITCASNEYVTRMALATNLYQGFDMGSCFTLELVDGSYEYTCTITPKEICTGHWISEQDSDTPYCTSSLKPENPLKVNNIYQRQEMTLTDFEDLGLEVGDEYQGGIYIGIFKPSPRNGRSSIVRGNINFGTPTSDRFVADSVGGVDNQWALIVDTTNYSVPFLLENEQDIDFKTSLWDGYYNTYGDGTFNGIQSALTNTVKYTPRKGFIDYYLPSIYEINFYAQYLYENNKDFYGSLISSSIFNSKYINNSTNRTKIKNKSFVYGSHISNLNTVNYRNILIDKRNIETALFFRRIVLT